MLTVPEQYAGQLMKCPLCAGTFTVPALPPPPSLAEPAPPPPPPAPPVSHPDTYAVKQELVTPPAPPPSAPSVSPPAPSTSAVTSSPPPPSKPPVGYTRTRSVWISPRVLQWVPAVCVVLIFLLQWFTWVGVFPGGVAAYRQGAWSAAFGTGEANLNVETIARVDPKGVDVSVPLIFYVILFLLDLVLTTAVAVIPFVQLPNLPPVVKQMLPYRWGIVAVLNLVVLLFLVLQLFLGFGLESYWTAKVNKDIPAITEGKTDVVQVNQANRGIQLGFLERTGCLWLALVLHILAILAAALMYWISQRGESRPVPKIEMHY